MTTLNEIQQWWNNAKREGATHLLVVCDTFDHEDYPVPCKSAEECLEQYDKHNGKNMQTVMEVYEIARGWTDSSKRCFHLPARKTSEPRS